MYLRYVNMPCAILYRMLKNLLDYQRLQQTDFTDHKIATELCEKGFFRARAKPNDYYYIEKTDPADPGGNHYERTGWKVHISVARDDVTKAWARIAPLAINAGMEIIKVASPDWLEELSHKPESPQHGKAIVLYDTKDAKVDYQSLLQSIEDTLATSCRPSVEIKGDKRLQGSRYLSYVNDMDPQGHYIRAKDRQRFAPQMQPNIYERPDLFADVRIVQRRWMGGGESLSKG